MTSGYFLAILIISMIACTELTTLAVGDGPVDLSGGHKPTYYPPGTFAVGDGPVDLSRGHEPTYYPPGTYPSDISHDQGNAKASIQNPQDQIQVKFTLVEESNEPIPGAQLNCRDGAGNSINPQGLAVILDTPAGQRHNPANTITDHNGDATITGSPGTWQFSVYKSGFFSNALTYPFTNSTSMVLMLQEVGSLEKLDSSRNKGKNEFITKKIIISAFCSNATEPSGNEDVGQSTYANDEAMG
jgi:hypothetical protein